MLRLLSTSDCNTSSDGTHLAASRQSLNDLILSGGTTTAAKVTAKYRAVTEQVSQLPFARGLADDSIERYTVGKALDGLFYMLGEEEKRIRTDPAARVTDLLKTVFK